MAVTRRIHQYLSFGLLNGFPLAHSEALDWCERGGIRFWPTARSRQTTWPEDSVPSLVATNVVEHTKVCEPDLNVFVGSLDFPCARITASMSRAKDTCRPLAPKG